MCFQMTELQYSSLLYSPCLHLLSDSHLTISMGSSQGGQSPGWHSRGQGCPQAGSRWQGRSHWAHGELLGSWQGLAQAWLPQASARPHCAVQVKALAAEHGT